MVLGAVVTPFMWQWPIVIPLSSQQQIMSFHMYFTFIWTCNIPSDIPRYRKIWRSGLGYLGYLGYLRCPAAWDEPGCPTDLLGDSQEEAGRAAMSKKRWVAEGVSFRKKSRFSTYAIYGGLLGLSISFFVYLLIWSYLFINLFTNQLVVSKTTGPKQEPFVVWKHEPEYNRELTLARSPHEQNVSLLCLRSTFGSWYANFCLSPQLSWATAFFEHFWNTKTPKTPVFVVFPFCWSYQIWMSGCLVSRDGSLLESPRPVYACWPSWMSLNVSIEFYWSFFLMLMKFASFAGWVSFFCDHMSVFWVKSREISSSERNRSHVCR